MDAFHEQSSSQQVGEGLPCDTAAALGAAVAARRLFHASGGVEQRAYLQTLPVKKKFGW